MNHVTLNTGHTRVSPRSEVSGEAIDALRGLLVPGYHTIPGTGWGMQVTTHGDEMMATIFVGKRPLVTLAVGVSKEGSADLWDGIIDHAKQLTGTAGKIEAMPSPPWCAAVIILPTPEEAAIVADLERCLAWAWIEQRHAAQN